MSKQVELIPKYWLQLWLSVVISRIIKPKYDIYKVYRMSDVWNCFFFLFVGRVLGFSSILNEFGSIDFIVDHPFISIITGGGVPFLSAVILDPSI